MKIDPQIADAIRDRQFRDRLRRTDLRIIEAGEILETGGQRQDALQDQLDDVLYLARKAGCYDALDHIERRLRS